MKKRLFYGSVLAGSIFFLAWCLLQHGRERKNAAAERRDRGGEQAASSSEQQTSTTEPGMAKANDVPALQDEDKSGSEVSANLPEAEEGAISEEQRSRQFFDEIASLAASQSREELVRTILEHPRKALWLEKEASCKVAWALSLQADRNPKEVCELLYHTLVGMDTASTSTERLLAILGYCQHDEARDALIRLLRSGWTTDRESLLAALITAGGKAYGTIEEQIRSIGECPPDERGFHVLSMGSPGRLYLISPTTVQALLDVYDTDAKAWEWNDKSRLIGGFKVILENWTDATRMMRYNQTEIPASDRVEQISARLKRDLAVADDADERWRLLDALCESPDADMSRILCHYMEHDPDRMVRLNCAASAARPFEEQSQVQEALLRVAKSDPSATVRLCALFTLPSTGEFTGWKTRLAMEEYERSDGGTWEGYAIRQKVVRALYSAGQAGMPLLRAIAERDADQRVQAEARKHIGWLERSAKYEEEARQRQRR